MSADSAGLAERPAPHRRRPARDTWQRLLDQLWQLAGGPGDLLAHSERAWASATFSGTRHGFTLEFSGSTVACGETLIAGLPEHEFAIPGQLVADATVISVIHVLLPVPRLTVTCDLLLLEEG